MVRVLAVGEVLWDLFPDGRRLGGAPFNVAFHARQLGIDAAALSRVGDDDLGEEIRRIASSFGFPEVLIQQDPQRPTGTVSVALDARGVPRFTIARDVAWDAIAFTPEVEAVLSGLDAICFGTLAQRSPGSRATIRGILAETRPRIVLCDINLRPPFVDPEVIRASLAAATILKLNDGELDVLREILGLPSGEDAACARLRAGHDLSIVCVTKGERGCTVFSPEGRIDVPGRKVGSGDAFAAGFLADLLAGSSIERAARFANDLGALVASRAGATPDLRDALPALRGR